MEWLFFDTSSGLNILHEILMGEIRNENNRIKNQIFITVFQFV